MLLNPLTTGNPCGYNWLLSSTVTADTLALMYQAVSIHNTDTITIVCNQYNKYRSFLRRKNLGLTVDLKKKTMTLCIFFIHLTTWLSQYKGAVLPVKEIPSWGLADHRAVLSPQRDFLHCYPGNTTSLYWTGVQHADLLVVWCYYCA